MVASSQTSQNRKTRRYRHSAGTAPQGHCEYGRRSPSHWWAVIGLLVKRPTIRGSMLGFEVAQFFLLAKPFAIRSEESAGRCPRGPLTGAGAIPDLPFGGPLRGVIGILAAVAPARDYVLESFRYPQRSDEEQRLKST